MRYLSMQYDSVLKMSTAQRRYHLNMFIKKSEEASEKAKENAKKSKNGKTKTISGDELKKGLKSGKYDV